VPDTFCIYPWKHLLVTSGGETRLCCQYLPFLSEEGVPLTVRQLSLDEIWNSDTMRRVRQAMVEGRFVKGCELCYEQEAANGFSLRTTENDSWEKGWLNERRIPLRVLQEEAITSRFRVANAPLHFEMDVGNLCNLKCRMCNGAWSSRIGADPVHGKWVYQGPTTYGAQSWVRDEATVERVLQHPEQVRFLKLLGGETLLIKEVGYLLQRLIDAGAAAKTSLHIITNATTTRTPWLSLIGQFERTYFAVSIDGFGKHFEYIRYPARWDKLLNNVAILRGLPKAEVAAHVTVQINNVLHVTDLLRFLDSIGLSFCVNPLSLPRYLQASILPPRARRLAAQRLRDYGERACRPDQRDRVLGLAAGLESADAKPDAGLLRDFMLFTNDLDRSRGQDIRATDPELVQLLAQDGFPWLTDTLHAPR